MGSPSLLAFSKDSRGVLGVRGPSQAWLGRYRWEERRTHHGTTGQALRPGFPALGLSAQTAESEPLIGPVGRHVLPLSQSAVATQAGSAAQTWLLPVE